MRLSHSRFLSMFAALALTLTASDSVDAAKAKQAGQPKSTAKSVTAVPKAKVQSASKKIDQLVDKGLKKHKVKPNPRTTDEVFLRRVYLDIVGRIPTLQEAKAFLDSNDKNKRSKLIDKLLDSEGYVSHMFNYWADLLRLQSRMRYAPAQPYVDYVKDSIRENKPYDQIVRELVTAEGYTWDNGAAGYYIRDTGMPLDNMSNTVQIFLGTQLVCAQCHDHPFDSWTQLQYYQLAAFTYGVETRDRRNSKYMELREMRRDADMDREVYRAANRIMQPLAYRVHEAKKNLQLPKDYQYNNAKPRQKIDPKTIFGEELEVKEGQSPKEIYANWMTSKKNPRFTTVIANRLWKRAMGLGLIEPVDDFRDGVNPTNPELMNYLVNLMKDLDFDMKQYLRVLYNTDTYQREVTTEELAEEHTYQFPGPVLARLSAEQLWDSMLAMVLPQLDERKGRPRNYGRYDNGEELVKLEMSEILNRAKTEAKRRKAQVEYREKTADLNKEMRIAQRSGDREKVNKLRDKINEIRKEIYGEVTIRRERNRARQRYVEKDPRWKGFSTDLVRASEVESPARPGHFLRQFGQSDRETIENASTEASVPQILTLLNGPIYYQLYNRNSEMAKQLANASTPQEKAEVLFLSILSRRPTERELKLVVPKLNSGSKGITDVAWALLNTRQFMFKQ